MTLCLVTDVLISALTLESLGLPFTDCLKSKHKTKILP